MIPLLLNLALTCSLSADITPSSLTTYKDCRKVEKQVETVIYWQPLIETYFKTEDIPKALMIIYCESKGKSKAVGNNKNGTQDVGLWQFNDDTWSWLQGKLKFTGNRFDPVLSTKVAKWLIYNDGWYHWNSSKHCWKDIETVMEDNGT